MRIQSGSDDANARSMAPSMSHGPGFSPGGQCNWEAGLDDLDLSMVLNGIRLLARHHGPRPIPLSIRTSRPNPMTKPRRDFRADQGLV